MQAEVKRKNEERRREMCLSNRQRVELFKKVMFISFTTDFHQDPTNVLSSIIQTHMIFLGKLLQRGTQKNVSIY